MLTWDDFNSEERKAAPATSTTTEKIAQSEPEVVQPTKETSSMPKSNLISDVSEALESLDVDAGMKDLEGASGRVNVDQKQMINCRADVNQLVPFKYD